MTNRNDTRHSAECPHPDCGKVIRIPDTTQAGEYQCPCHACTIKMTWATYINKGRQPYLRLAGEGDAP